MFYLFIKPRLIFEKVKIDVIELGEVSMGVRILELENQVKRLWWRHFSSW